MWVRVSLFFKSKLILNIKILNIIFAPMIFSYSRKVYHQIIQLCEPRLMYQFFPIFESKLRQIILIIEQHTVDFISWSFADVRIIKFSYFEKAYYHAIDNMHEV